MKRPTLEQRMALICACGECGIDPATWECESRFSQESIDAAYAELDRRVATGAKLAVPLVEPRRKADPKPERKPVVKADRGRGQARPGAVVSRRHFSRLGAAASFGGRRARYEVLDRASPKGYAVTIVDVGPWDAHPTVTNDAESVVADLVARGYVKSAGDRVSYFDSEGELAELRHDGVRFLGFGPASPVQL